MTEKKSEGVGTNGSFNCPRTIKALCFPRNL